FCSQCAHSAPSGVAARCGTSAQLTNMLLPTATVLMACIQRPQSGAKVLNWKMWRRPFCELIQPSSSLPSGVVARLGEAEPGSEAGSGQSSMRLGAPRSMATADAGAAASSDPPQPPSASVAASRIVGNVRLVIGWVLGIADGGPGPAPPLSRLRAARLVDASTPGPILWLQGTQRG